MVKGVKIRKEESCKIFFEIFEAPVKLAVLKSAVEMGIADILSEESCPEKIGLQLGVKSGTDNLVFFLDALAAVGFCEKKNGEYFNNENAEKFLIKNSNTYLGDLVFNMCAMQHRNLDKITELVKTGFPELKAVEKLETEDKWKNAVKHLASYQRSGMADFSADIISSIPEFQTAHKILDLGCGPGIMCMEILRRKSDLKGVLFDLPGIIKLAKEEAFKEKITSRVEFLSGDYNVDDFGKNYDIIWASHNLYYVKEPVAFFRRLLGSLNPGGVFVCLHEGYSNERTYPGNIVLSRLSLALEGQDVSFEKGEIAENLLKAGFVNVESEPVFIPSGESELVTARKG